MNPYRMMFDTAQAFRQLGINQMPKDKAARILAYTHTYGTEDCSLNPGFNAAIGMAAGVANIDGGLIPDIECTILIQRYIKDTTPTKGRYERKAQPWEIFKPQWAYDLEKEYNLRPVPVDRFERRQAGEPEPEIVPLDIAEGDEGKLF